ncbi:hypothetical protein V8E53_000937 [Lactarius tabidus]
MRTVASNPLVALVLSLIIAVPAAAQSRVCRRLHLINLAKAWCVGLLLAPECCGKGADLRRSSSFRPRKPDSSPHQPAVYLPILER